MTSICAHRGGALLWPENSLTAFRQALALAIEEVECDVHLSADGVVLAGEGEIDRSRLTGEPLPAAVGVGDEVWAGTVNLSAVLTVRVTRAGAETLAGPVLIVEDRATIHRKVRDIAPVEQDPPGVGLDQPHHRVKTGGLARAVGTEQADHLAAMNAQRDVVEHRALVVGLGDRAHLEPAHGLVRFNGGDRMAAGIEHRPDQLPRF